jgi:hypothetical protein
VCCTRSQFCQLARASLETIHRIVQVSSQAFFFTCFIIDHFAGVAHERLTRRTTVTPSLRTASHSRVIYPLSYPYCV